MKRRGDLAVRDLVWGAGVAAACALGFGVALAAWSAPADFDSRLADVTAKTDRTEALLKPPRTPPRFGADAVCTQSAEQQAVALRQTLEAEAGRNSLVVVSADARPEPAADLEARLAPVRLRFTATGSYEGAVALLALMARERPQLFVDSLDLTPKTANVTLSFSGRVFCAVS